MSNIDMSQIVTAEDKAAAKAEAKRETARATLAATDWMVVRQAETGKAVPPEIAESRAAAREALH